MRILPFRGFPAAATVQPPAVPANLVPPTIPATLDVGGALTDANVDMGAWHARVGDAGLSFSLRVLRGTTAVATSLPYVAAPADVATGLRVGVTATALGQTGAEVLSNLAAVIAAVASPATLADDFNRGDGDINGANGWARIDGSAPATISGNRLAAGSGSYAVYKRGDLPGQDLRLTVTFLGSTWSWVCFRMVDANNWLGWRHSSLGAQLVHYQNGAENFLATYPTAALGSETRVEIVGNTVRYWRAGVETAPTSGSGVLPATGMPAGTGVGIQIREPSSPWLDTLTFAAAAAAAAPSLGALTAAGASVAEEAGPGAVVGAIAGKTAGSTLSLANDAGGRFALSGTNIVTGPNATDFETAAFHDVVLTETLARAANSPRQSTIRVNVTDVTEGGGVFTISDDFTRSADENLEASLNWTRPGNNGNAGALAIRSGRLAALQPGTTTLYRHVKDMPGADLEVSVRFYGWNWSGICFRMSDAQNLAGIGRNGTDGRLYYFHRVAGSESILVAYPYPADGALVTFRLVGTTPTLRYDGVLQTPVSTSGTISASLTGRGVGLRSAAGPQVANPWIDNLVFTDIAASAGPSVPVPAGRIAPLASLTGGRPAPIRQAFYDTALAEYGDPVSHPSLGTTTHFATRTGNWSDATLWDTGTVPGENAVVDVGNFDVTYDRSSTSRLRAIKVGRQGTLRWSKTTDTLLWCYTIMVMGRLVMGDHQGPIPESATLGKSRAEVVWWFPEQPGTTTKGGLMTMGPVRIFGAPKAEKLILAADVPAGQSFFMVAPAALAASGLRVQDEIVLQATSNAGKASTDPSYTGPTQVHDESLGSVQTPDQGFYQSHDEPRRVTAINATTGRVDVDSAFAWAHVTRGGSLPDGTAVSLKPRASVLSRSITFRSAGGVAGDATVWPASVNGGPNLATLQKRGHAMFMHSDDVWVGFSRFKDMGRTSTDPSLADPDPTVIRRATNGGASVTDPNNVRGRYPVHHHMIRGDSFAFKQAVFLGLVADGQPGPSLSAIPVPGWGIVHHGGRLAIERCVTYNVRGAGIVSERGPEIGQWLDNDVLWCRGDAFYVRWGSRAERWLNHNGHQGVAYENQSRQVLIQRNHFTSSRMGFCYLKQDQGDVGLRSPDHLAMRLRDPLAHSTGRVDGQPLGQTESVRHAYGDEQAQIPDFFDNTGVGFDSAVFVSHRQFTDRSDTTPGIFRRCHFFEGGVAFENPEYSFNYSFYDCLWRGLHSGARLPNVGWAMSFVNVRVQDATNGFEDWGIRHNYNGFWVAQGGLAGMFVNVGTPFAHGSIAISDPDDDPTNHPSYDLMGPWQITNHNSPSPGYTANVRPWTVLEPSALPLAAAANYPKVIRTDPAPGQARPRFTRTGSFDLDISPNDPSITLRGALADGIGLRRLGDWMSAESWDNNKGPLADPRRDNPNGRAPSTVLVERNGCFNDAGTWKMPLWFVEHDRLTGAPLLFREDVTLTGFDAGFLAANTVDPVAIRPPDRILPEAIPQTPSAMSASSATTPTLVSATALGNHQQRSTLAHQLRCGNKPHPIFTLGGTHASLFTVSAGGVLSFAGGTAPAPSGGSSQALSFAITVSDGFGNSSAAIAHALTLTL